MNDQSVLSNGEPRWRAVRLLGPRPGLLLAFAALVVALVVAFGYVAVHAQSQSRRQAEQRFDAEARLSAQLTSSLFSTSATASEAAAAKALGGPEIGRKTLDSLAASGGLLYVLVLDRAGKVIAGSAAAPSTIDGRPAADLAHVRAALAGRPSFSGILPGGRAHPGGILEWALPFTTPSGRRVEVEALAPAPIFRFLTSYLAKTRTDGHGTSYVLDALGHIVGVSGAEAKPGSLLNRGGLLPALATHPTGTYSYAGTRRYYSSAPVSGSTWQVVLSVRTSLLYPALAGSESWFVDAELGAFVLAGVASLLFFRQALRRGAELAGRNAELLHLNTTLEERVAERTADAEERARELARSNDELEQFSSVASHDLQEPLRKIRMFGDRLRERLGDSLPEEAAADLARMSNAAVRMQRLINDLLDYSRVTHRGKEFERVSLDEVTQEVVADLEARVVELEAQIVVGELPVIDADRTQMRQLIQNLVGNALKFHRDGEPPVVHIRSEVIGGHASRFPGEPAVGDRCVLTVEDNGIGFDEKHAERVFTAFERLHGRSAYEGTGIGLSIARKIVWRHGGHITANGEPDRGATFTVTLPVFQGGRASQSNGQDGGTST